MEIQSTAPQNCDPDFSFDAAAIIDDSIVLLKNRYSAVLQNANRDDFPLVASVFSFEGTCG